MAGVIECAQCHQSPIDIEALSPSQLCCGGCDHCGDLLGASFYADVPGHGDLCRECHVWLFSTSEDWEFPGDVQARQIRSLDAAAQRIDGARQRIATAIDLRRKPDGTIAAHAEIAEARVTLQEVMDYLRTYGG